MTKSITQDNQNDNQISASIRKFFTRFHLSSALKAANAYKAKGIPVTEIYQYLFLLIFSNRSMYMNMLTGRNTPTFAKDTVYRFMVSCPPVRSDKNFLLLSMEVQHSLFNRNKKALILPS